jgi:hypothetical protein
VTYGETRVKIVIFGLGKSGTTALFYKVRSSLPPATISLFEPSSYGPADRLREQLRALGCGRIARHVLAKVLPCGSRPVRVRDFDRFDRQVLIVRDPRDRLISALLYRSYDATFATRDKAALEYLALLRRKEADPRSLPVLSLVEAFEALRDESWTPTSWLDRYRNRAVTLPLRFHGERQYLPVFRYENLVDERFGELEEILGFSLGGSASVPDLHRRVLRTKRYGGWRDWFTAEDVEALRPVVGPFLELYYPDAAWDLNPSPRIESKHASLYARRLIDEQRALRWLQPLPA